jgi:type II secretory pathway pseudopilin PulG
MERLVHKFNLIIMMELNVLVNKYIINKQINKPIIKLINKQRGDTIVEVMFAMAIIGLTLGIGYGIANRAIIIGRDAQEQTESSKFVEAQLEKIITVTANQPELYFSTLETPGTTFCIDDTLTRQVAATPATQCRFGPINSDGVGRYGVTIVRNGNIFTITGRWDNTRGSYQSTSSMVYRTYDYSVAVAPPAPVPPVPPVPLPLIIGPLTHIAGISNVSLTGSVTQGTPTSRVMRITRVATGTFMNVNIATNTFTNIVATPLYPNEAYTYQLTVSNGVQTVSSAVVPFNTLPITIPNSVSLATFGGSTYYLSNDLVTWDQANAIAQSQGGHLVTFSSAAENTFVSNQFPQTSWIGLTDSATEGVWQWVTGEPFNFNNWSPSEPNDYQWTPAGQDYGLTNWIPASASWDDQGGYELHRYVVEFDGKTPPTSTLGSTRLCIVGFWGCATYGASAYDCGNFNMQYSFNPSVGANYNAVVLNYADNSTNCTVGPNPPAAFYNYRINVYVNGALNVSNYALVPTIAPASAYETIPITPPAGPINSVNIEWINNMWVSDGSGNTYDPDLMINNVALGYQ